MSTTVHVPVSSKIRRNAMSELYRLTHLGGEGALPPPAVA